MVLQDYGAAVPAPEPSVGVTGRRLRTVSLVAVAAVAMALLVMAVSTGSAGKSELVQEQLSQQHLMSQFSGSDTSDSSNDGDDTSMLSSGGGQSSSGWYGHWSDGASSASSQPNWQKQLQKMEARAAARRARENKRFFSGVDKAFGKKAGKAMLAAFNGKAKNVLTKFKLNEKKLDEQKKKIAENTVVPATHKQAAHDKMEVKHAAKKEDKEAKGQGKGVHKAESSDKADAHKKKADAHKEDAAGKKKADAKKLAAEKTAKLIAAKKIDHEAEAKKAAQKEALQVAKKMAEHTDPSADKKSKATKAPKADEVKKADDEKKADAKEEASVVKDALKIAKSMSQHKDPVYKAPKKEAHHHDKSSHKQASKHAKPTIDSLQHQGLLEKSEKLEKLVNEAKHAHGKAKKQLKARVMQLQEEITDGTKAVEQYGDRAKTAFARAVAKEHAGNKDGSKKQAHESRRDMSDEQRLKADGWH